MKILFFMFLVACSQIIEAQSSEILWMQQPSISPDGRWIAFEYKGNIFKVSSSGGTASPLTSTSSYSGYPIWSHDGTTIAFASDRYGNFDIYTMPSSGGDALRLTFDSSRDIPYDFSPDNTKIYFGTNRSDPSQSVRFPSTRIWVKLYSVPVKGGRSVLVNAAGTEYVHFNSSGTKFIFQDRKGGENAWRKHHTSSVTRDIWSYDSKTREYTKLSAFKGEDREPLWGDGTTFYYLSEQNGNQNLYRSSTENPQALTQLTKFEMNPVRNLSRSETGLLTFTQDGQLFTLKEGNQPTKITITAAIDFNDSQIRRIPVTDNVTQMAVSPDAKEIAFVSHGEVFVAAVDGSATKRITNTPYREDMVSFSPDGRQLIYSVENEGSWDIYRATIANAKEPFFYSASTITLSPLIATPKNEFQATVSPDGKKIAYLEEGNILKIYDLESHATTTALPTGSIFPYSDGDQNFSWSPDSHYILIASSQGQAASDNVILLNAESTSKPLKLTQSGFNTLNPKWGMEGKIFYYRSEKLGMASLSHSERQSDVYAVFLDRAGYDSYFLPGGQDDSKGQANTGPKTRTYRLIYEPIDIEKLDKRTIKLTDTSAGIIDALLSPDGQSLYYIAKYQTGFDLWVSHPKTHENKLLAALGANGAAMQLSGDGRSIFVLADGKIYKTDTQTGSTNPIAVHSYIDLDTQAERRYIYEHIYHSMPRKFFDSNLQGVQWNYYHERYSRFLPHINNNFDFQLLLNEYLGELNSSHTGAIYNPNYPQGDKTASLGLLYDSKTATDGLVVEGLLSGGPFDKAGSKMKAGYIIDRIDNVALTKDKDWASLLNNKKGEPASITFHNAKTKTVYTETVLPISKDEEARLLYERWVAQMERQTDSLSGGSIGYIHIALMNDSNYRDVLDRVNGKYYAKKALIIDTRYNPGGNLQDKLISLFSEKTQLIAKPQGYDLSHNDQPDGSFRPTSVLVSEGNYSDGFNFPYLYQRLGIGKLIGTPVAGSGTGVYWEEELDESLTVGFPQTALSWFGEPTLLENQKIEPDIKIYTTFNTVLEGIDLQLEKAVSQMLLELSVIRKSKP